MKISGTQNSLTEINIYVKDETRKAPGAGTPARIDQAKIKKVAAQSAKQISKPEPADQASARSAPARGNTPAKTEHALADLVWKYFSEEITEAIIEVQEAFAHRQAG